MIRRTSKSNRQAFQCPGALVKTYCEFTFEAAHSVPPYSGLHGHTFVAKLTFGGVPDAKFGWPINLYVVEAFIREVKGDHQDPGLDHSNLDERPGIGVASLENITKHLWTLFKARFPELEEVELKRGFAGSILYRGQQTRSGGSEGCIYRGDSANAPALGLVA